MAVLDSVKPFFRLHYATNLLLAALFFILKTTPIVCDALFQDCKLELREWEWLTFLGCIIVLKNRRQVNLASYLTTACTFGKALNFILFFKQSIALGIVYVCLCLLHFVFLPQPVYEGPEKIVYFRGPNLQEELERDKRITWLVSFYAAWSPQCLTFAPIFSELSAEYGLDNLKFGKMDVSRYQQVADKFGINTSTWSKQLPTVILFQEGKEKIRRPVSTKKTTLKFPFTKENVVRDFELNEVYGQCKKNPLPSRRKDKDMTEAKKEN
ncbi:thioredoxin-related transmembrane protein 2-like [Pomacea canaliculata]|uniref:thioredoxin-related transmembrane protein 2-like n=1 Tax=Pomacea canaliculata TaxID=400727 RepID=UPI000D73ED08|nr:thioredoxin-related transmembrane protein 2-like [Pomacea canaliculata]